MQTQLQIDFENKIKEQLKSFTNLAVDEKTQYAKTSTGETIPFKIHSSQVHGSSGNLLQREKSTFQDDDYWLIERQFTFYHQLSFTAGTKIKSANDVAWLFRNLENEAVEHAFIVYLTKYNSYVVQHLSTGGITGTAVDMSLFVGNAIDLKAEAVIFVHNHPSGQLKASGADIKLWKTMNDALKRAGIILHEGVIINLKSGQYATFNGQSTEINNLTEQNQKQHNVKILSFSKQIFAQNYTPTKIIDSKDAAGFISTQKFGIADKIELLAVNRAKNIVGKFLLDKTKDLYPQVVSLVSKYGGTEAILYGNKPLVNIKELAADLQKTDITLLDYLEIESGNLAAYKSAADMGLINEPFAAYSSIEVSTKAEEPGAREVDKPVIIGKERSDLHGEFREIKTKLRKLGFPVNETIKIIDHYWEKQKLDEVMKIPDNSVLIKVPSTSNKNIIPDLLALKIKDFNKEIKIVKRGFVIRKHFLERKNIHDPEKRLEHPAGYVIQNPEKLKKALEGKNVYIVDDLMATGESAVRVKKALQNHGISVNGYINLVNVSNRYPSLSDRERFCEKIMKYVSVKDPEKLRRDINDYLCDYTRQKQNRIERSITNEKTALKAVDIITRGAQQEKNLFVERIVEKSKNKGMKL